MTNPLTAREAPDPMTLTGFSPKAQQELERNKFAAVTGGLVNVSARTYWELHYAAIAWHDHLKQRAGAAEPSAWASVYPVPTEPKP